MGTGGRLVRRARAALVLAVALVLGAVAVPVGPAADAVDAPACSKLALIGDSLFVGAATPTLEGLGAAGIVDLAFSAERGRRIPQKSRNSGQRALKALRAQGYEADCYVIGLGTNDVYASGDPLQWTAWIEALLAEIGDVPVLWVNVFRADGYAARAEAFDQLLVDLQATHPKLQVADWATQVAPHPEWLAIDRYHLRKPGWAARADWLVGEIVDRLYAGSVPALPPACPVTTKLRIGNRHDEVACLETRLAQLGFTLAAPPDRFFDKASARAVARFQSWHRLGPSGTVTPATAAALGLAPAAPVGVAVGAPEADVPLRSFSIAASGDVIPLPSVAQRALGYGRGSYDFRPMFADIAPIVSAADLGICHLEIPIHPPGSRPRGFPAYSTPPEIADAMVWAGYDRCSTASNHSLDQGLVGIDTTLNMFDMAGLDHSGTARTPQEAVPELFDVQGVRVAHLAYTYGFNNKRLPVGEEWRANRIDEAKILAAAADARQRGAEFVVLSLHWGNEFAPTPSEFQRTLADHLTAAGSIDLIIGHHTHVLQGIEQVNGRWVVYGMGNLLSNHRPETGYGARSEDGMVVTLEVTENPGGGFTVARPVVHPTWSQPATYRIVDALAPGVTLKKSAQRRMEASLARTRKLLGAYFPA